MKTNKTPWETIVKKMRIIKKLIKINSEPWV